MPLRTKPLVVIEGNPGCLAEETEILDPVTGLSVPVADRHACGKPFNVLSINRMGDTCLAKANPPVRGPSMLLYKIRLSNGTSFRAPASHRVLTRCGWKTIGQLLSSDASGVGVPSLEIAHRESSQSPPPTNQAFGPRVLLRDAQRSRSILQGSRLHCSDGPRRCDGRPHSASSSDRAPAPLPTCALGRAQHGHCVGVVDTTQEHSHLCQSSSRPSMQDFQPRHTGPSPFGFEHQVQQVLQEHDARLYAFPQQFEQSCALRGTSEQLHACACRSIPDSTFSCVFPQQDQCAPITIESIEKDVKGVYYDFHVPGTNSYWASGIWHHNSGKSTAGRELAKRLNLRLLPEPVDYELLTLFYDDKDRWSFPFQMAMLHERWALQMSAAAECIASTEYDGAILDRCILGDMVFARMLWECGKIHKKEWEIYCRAVRNMMMVLFPPTVLLYLNARPETCMERIKERNRPQEAGMTIEYLQGVHSGYLNLIKESKSARFPWSHAMTTMVVPWDPITASSQDWDRTAAMLKEAYSI